MTDLVHLHVQSHYSLLDGLSSPEELVEAAKDVGHTSIAITDHGTSAGHRGLQRAARAAGLKPILGVEAYFSPTDRFDRRSKVKRSEQDAVYNHVVLLAKNQTGLSNLQSLSNIAWNEGYYYKPRIDFESLSENGDGLIALSGCLNGVIAKAVARGDMQQAEIWTRAFKERFGDDFYMEVQEHNPLEINRGLLDLADLYSVKPVITADCHFATEAQRGLEEAFLILSTKPKKADGATYAEMKTKKGLLEKFNYLYPERQMSFQEWDLYLTERSHLEAKMVTHGIPRLDVYENTLEIADKIGDYEYHSGLDLLPRPIGDNHVSLSDNCNAAMVRLGFNKDPVYVERLAHELAIIKSKDFSRYFLIVAEAIEWARKEDILVGPGRGSAAGSLVCYLTGITQVDPIPYKLLFSRFIDEAREDWPDIDIDFEDRRRSEVKQHMVDIYPSVSNIATYSFFKEKGVVKDAARVFSVPHAETEAMLKKVEDFDSFEESPETQDYRNKYPEVLDLARNLRGRIRGTGLHAAGVVLSNEPIEKYIPVESRTDTDSKDKSRLPALAYDMEEVADIGAIKIDFLGLSTLTIIQDTLRDVNSKVDQEISLPWIFDDKRVYNLLSAGNTVGVFQAEQGAYTKLLKEMGVNDFNDLAASTALVRPGAYDTVGVDYIARKHGRAQVVEVHPIYDAICEETYGVIIYQEQVMRACTELAGMSSSDANKIRRIIGKKKDSREFDIYKQKFLDGASVYIPIETAEKLWHDFEAHAGYSFNKSHAVAYSYITYWTAWLKCYFPTEFLCAVLNAQDSQEKYTSYLIEAKRLGIKITLPHVQTSPINFEVRDGKICYGLSKVKWLSEVTAAILVKHRPYTKYSDLRDVVVTEKTGISVRIEESLNKVGAAVFKDHPLVGDEASHYYSYLGIPTFDTSKSLSTITESVQKADEADETGVSILMGMAKKIVRKNGWCRAEFMDDTGAFSGFTTPSTQIVEGDMYLVLRAGSSISRYISVSDLPELAGDPLVRYMSGDVKVAEKQCYVLAFSSRMSKKGSHYAEIILANSKGEMRKVMAFNKSYVKALAFAKPGRMVAISVGTMDDGTLVLREIELIDNN